MTGPKRMDELFWGKDLEDVFDQVKRLQMAIEVQEYDEDFFSNLLNLTYVETQKTSARY